MTINTWVKLPTSSSCCIGVLDPTWAPLCARKLLPNKLPRATGNRVHAEPAQSLQFEPGVKSNFWWLTRSHIIFLCRLLLLYSCTTPLRLSGGWPLVLAWNFDTRLKMPSTTNIVEEHQPFNYQHQKTNPPPSSSTVTVQRAASIGPSRSTPQPLASLQDLQGTANASSSTTNFSKPVTSHELRRRQSASHSRSSSVNGVRDGIGNLNRWSQSTTSSKGSASHTRSDSISRRMSFGGSGTFAFGASSIQPPNKLQKARKHAAESPSRQPSSTRPVEPPLKPTTSLPPIVTLPISQLAANIKSSPLTATTSTPSTAGLLSAAVRSTVPDYFGKTWEETTPRDYTHSKKRDRSPIDSLQSSAVYSAKHYPNSSSSSRQRQEAENSLGRGRPKNRPQVGKSSSGTTTFDKSKDRGTKLPSQKAMLSIALQKANTAVLLDNAQNFEGAMQAYSEACSLLQQVMMRSSGEEDKRKLDTIVSYAKTI